MSGDGGTSAAPAPVVTGGDDYVEEQHLRDLVGDREALREVEMGEDSGSELSELESSRMETEEEEEWEGKDRGRPNFARAAAGVGQRQSTQEFFCRGAAYSMGGLNIFDTPGKTPMRGALARSLSAAASSSPQQVGMAETPNFAKEPSEEVGMEVERGARLEGSKGVEGMDVAAEDWAEEVANQEEEERATTPTPTPACWATPTAAPVTPTKGSKRMALGTPKPGRRFRLLAARPAPIGFAAQSALEQILGAVARMEKKMEEKVAGLEARMIKGMGARAAEEEEREKRAARLLADAEEREKRIASRLLALDAIETELAQKGQWELKQWEDLARVLEARRRDIREVGQAVGSLASAMAHEGRAPQEDPGAAEAAGAAAPQAGPSLRGREAPTKEGAPQPMEGVVATAAAEEEGVQGDDMEGVEREGLYGSRHAPAPGEPAPTIPTGPATEEKGKKGKGKAKGKAVQIAVPPAPGRAARQRERHAAVDTAKAMEPEEPAVPIRSILKRLATAEAEKKEREKKREEAAARKEAEKATAMKRWEEGKLSQQEGETYSAAARPIRDLAEDAGAIEEVAAGQRIAHMVGMRALVSQWEEDWNRGQTAARQQQSRQQHQPHRPGGQQQQQQQRPQQQQQQHQQKQAPLRAPQQRQQQSSWAQRAAAVAALPQTDFRRVGKNGKPEREPTGLEPIKGSIPRDERGIVFERAGGAPQINPAVAASAAAFVNIALSKVAPAHIRTEAFRISVQGRLSTTARFGASATMLLQFKKEILEAARKADRAIINVTANETWAELKILVPYDRYRHPSGLAELREQIEAENPGVVIPPLSMKWMRAASTIERHYQAGRLPKNAASVIFKVPGKAAAQKLLVEMWVAGNKFHALPYIPDRADTLCGVCRRWGHLEFRCQRGVATCTICAGSHRTEEHRCQVATCGKVGKVCRHTEMKCPNCGGRHPAQDARCQAKRAAIEIARGRRNSTARAETSQPTRSAATGSSGGSARLNWVPGGEPAETSPDWTEDAMEATTTGMEPSGTAPPVAV